MAGFCPSVLEPAMQVFVRDDCSMIAAPVQCDVDGIPKGLHCVKVPPKAADEQG